MKPEESFIYTLTVKNTSEVNAKDVVVTDELPAGLVFISTTGGGKYDNSTHTVTWENVGTIPAGKQKSLTITVKASANAVDGDKYVNIAYVSSNDPTYPNEPKISDPVETEVEVPDDRYITVIFIDHDGTVMKVEKVKVGGSATPPGDPVHPGYTFDHWEGKWINVYEDSIVRAICYPPENEPGFYINDANIPLFGGYISNVGDCFD